MGIEEVTQARIRTAQEWSGHAGAISFLTMMGGAITAIVGHARGLPNVVEIGRWIALGGGLGVVGSMLAGLAVPKAIEIQDARQAIWALQQD